MNRRALLRGIAASGGVALFGPLAGCTQDDGGQGDGNGGQGDDGQGDGETTTTTSSTASGEATVTVSSTDAFGDILTDSDGMTLYLFTEDEMGESTCYDSCAENWPPLTVDGTPTAGDGVTAQLETVAREDGSMQVVAAGHPLYYYNGDQTPGDTNGQGVGDVWFVLGPDGSQKTQSGTTTAGNNESETTTTTASGGDSGTTTTDDDDGGYGGDY